MHKQTKKSLSLQSAKQSALCWDPFLMFSMFRYCTINKYNVWTYLTYHCIKAAHKGIKPLN